MTTDFPTAPPAYGLEGPSAGRTVEKSLSASHTEILTLPVAFNLYMVYLSIDFLIQANKFWKAQTLGISMKYVLLILPIAFSLMSVRILINLYLVVFKHVELLDPEAAELEKMKKQAAKLSS